MQEILKALKNIPELNEGTHSLHEPFFNGNEIKYTKECIDTGWVSSVGSYVDRFEKDLSEYTGAQFAVACMNGTAALHLALLLSDAEAGHEVLVPSLTFVATANAVSYLGATPHFVDCDMDSMGVCPLSLRSHLASIVERRGGLSFNKNTGRPITALIVAHILGHTADIDGLQGVCDEFNLQLLEDAAESLGSRYKGRHAGSFGVMSALSFNGNKIMTTGGGGALLTSDPDLAKRAKYLSTTAKRPHQWDFIHDEVGYNYRLPNINAALGCAQLEQMDEFLLAKKKLAELYRGAFRELDNVRFIEGPTFSEGNNWLNAFLLSDSTSFDQREELLHELHDCGILARPLWRLMHTLDMYKGAPRASLDNSESLVRRVICLPSSVGLIHKKLS